MITLHSASASNTSTSFTFDNNSTSSASAPSGNWVNPSMRGLSMLSVSGNYLSINTTNPAMSLDVNNGGIIWVEADLLIMNELV